MANIEVALITNSVFLPSDDDIASLQKEFPTFTFTVVHAKNATVDNLIHSSIIIGMIDPQLLSYLPHLKWLHSPTSGINQYIDRSLYASPDVILTNSSGVYGKKIGEYVMASILGIHHNLFAYIHHMREKNWLAATTKKELSESTVVIVGFGDIAQHVAKQAHKNGMNIIVIRKDVTKEVPSYIDTVYPFEKLKEAFQKADYLVLATSATQETHHLIHTKTLGYLKQSAYIINVGRGSLIDESALIDALHHKNIGGAILDVTEEEPLPPTSELWNFDNVVITPHVSGLSHENFNTLFMLIKKNLQAYRDHKPMTNVIDFNRGY
ncbi:MAG: D-2-hydroxyacid dehydrogenase [Sphaerochaetaceae bacterium]|jgi:phosphoglycerate dehydrogenase-like enzyme